MSAAAIRYRKPRVQGPGAAGQERLPVSVERRGMLAKVAIARKQLGMEEDAYRDLVQRMTGGRSAGAASDAALHRLIGEFGRLGWTPSRKQAASRRADDAQIRKVHALWAELGAHIADGSDSALRSFVRRQTRSRLHPDGVDASEFLDGEQARKVIEALKAWLARLSKRAGT